MHLAQLSGIPSPSSVFRLYSSLPEDLVSRFLVFAIALSGLFFFVRLLHSGFLYLTSIGDPSKVQAATKTLVNSLLGLFVVITSYFIAQIIFKILGIGEVV